MAELVKAGLGYKDAVIEYGTADRGWPGDVPKFAYDTSKIRSLGWKPKRNSREAVEASIKAEVEKLR